MGIVQSKGGRGRLLRPLVHLIWPRLAGQFTFQISDFIASRIAGITFHSPFAIFHFHFHYSHGPPPPHPPTSALVKLCGCPKL